jgi:hypothetical protein
MPGHWSSRRFWHWTRRLDSARSRSGHRPRVGFSVALQRHNGLTSSPGRADATPRAAATPSDHRMLMQPVFWIKIQRIERIYARRTRRRRAMPARPTSPVPSSSMLAGSGTSMLVSRSAAAGRTTGVVDAADGWECTGTDAGVMAYGSPPANAVAEATKQTPATRATERKRTDNRRGFMCGLNLTGSHPVAQTIARTIPSKRRGLATGRVAGSPTAVVRSGRSLIGLGDEKGVKER